jgi:DNA replication and repair protein RecF
MLTNLHLKNFRNHVDFSLEIESKQVVLVGQNGRGKTNVLEAIAVLSSGKSWREQRGEDLIEHDQVSAQIKALYDQTPYEVLVEPRSRGFFRHEKKISLKSHIGAIPSILFAPEFLGLFSGTKTIRQRFFDRFLSQLYPLYRENLSRAKKAAQNKVRLIKQYHAAEKNLTYDLVSPWNQILADSVPYVWQKRTEVLERILPIAQEELSKIAQNTDILGLTLISPENFVPTRAGVLEFFEREFRREVAARKNLLAPSRDDFSFEYRQKPLTTVASRGEERSILLALLLAQKKIWHEYHQRQPIILLDDCFSELDESRQEQLHYLCDASQVFFTTTHKSHFDAFGDVQVVEL